MNIKSTIFGMYFILAVGTAIYGSIWGDFNYKGVAYNIGRALVWPFIWFPTLGAIVGGVLLLIFIAYIHITKK
ncbi:hypothetical protein [Pectobacterium versatile]|uniref:hypothetical protein n=1 Tax=Pectobacterium versatile TaxID=2488639 RepID=UPI0020BDD8B3|nr:hypothetical protein [Pectobacterium versatile]